MGRDSKEDQYEFFLKHVNFEGAAKSAGMENLPTAKVFLSEPSYVKFWQDMAVEPHLKRPEVPTLEVGGYWDQEDMWGTQAEYKALREHQKPNEPLNKVWMVLGPWNHGGGRAGLGMSWAGSLGRLRLADRRRGRTIARTMRLRSSRCI